MLTIHKLAFPFPLCIVLIRAEERQGHSKNTYIIIVDYFAFIGLLFSIRLDYEYIV